MYKTGVASIILYVMLNLIPHFTFASAEQIRGLMNNTSFKHDAHLSNVLGEYFLNGVGRISMNGPSGNAKISKGYNPSINATLWLESVNPTCERLIETYEAATLDDVNKIKGFDNKVAHSKTLAEFRDYFNTLVFRDCRSYTKLIDEMNTSSVGIKHKMPRVLSRYADDLKNAAEGQSYITLYKSLKEHGAGSYKSRISQDERDPCFSIVVKRCWR